MKFWIFNLRLADAGSLLLRIIINIIIIFKKINVIYKKKKYICKYNVYTYIYSEYFTIDPASATRRLIKHVIKPVFFPVKLFICFYTMQFDFFDVSSILQSLAFYTSSVNPLLIPCCPVAKDFIHRRPKPSVTKTSHGNYTLTTYHNWSHTNTCRTPMREESPRE